MKLRNVVAAGCLSIFVLVGGVLILSTVSAGRAVRDAAREATARGPTAKQLKAQAAYQELADAGIICKADSSLARVWMDPGLWAGFNRDDKEQLIIKLAALQEALRGSPVVTVLSYQDDAELGRYGALGVSIKR